MSKPRAVKKPRTAAQPSIKTPAVSTWAVPIALIVISLVVFYPVLNGKFLNWDDQSNLLDYPYYRGFGWTHLRWMFTTFFLGNYRPLTWLTFAFDYTLWGSDPAGYHLTGLLLHGVSTLLFYFIAMRLLSLAFSIPDTDRKSLRVAAGFAALIFSIHPLRVEPVAWLSARNHLLAGLFYLGTILCYLRAATYDTQDRRHFPWFIVAVIFYLFSLLSQPSGILLPFVLLILDVYPLKRLGGSSGKWFRAEVRRVWWEKLPFLLLALGGAVLGIIAKFDAEFRPQQVGGFAWLAQALYKLGFYLGKTVVPTGLLPLYLLPVDLTLWDWPVILSALAVFGLTILAFVLKDRWPAGLASWLWYLAMTMPYVFLMPTIEGVQNSVQSTGDRYSYLSCLPWALLAGGGLLYWQRRMGKRKKFETSLVGSAVLIVVLILAGLSWKQTQVWRDSETLWRYVLTAGSKSTVAYTNLGSALMDQHRIDEAIDQFKMSLATNPVDAAPYFEIGLGLSQKQDPEGAMENYQMALRANPDYLRGIYALSVELAKKGRFDEAIEQLKHALKIKNGRSRAYFNMANVYIMQRRGQEAIYYLRLALQEQPDFAEADDQLGNALAAQGNLAEAVQHLRRAVGLDPEWAEAQFDLANALVRQGNLTEAVEHFEKALQRRPDYVEAHNSLGRVLAAQGDLASAIEHFRAALRLRPDFVPARESLAMAIEEQRTQNGMQSRQEPFPIRNAHP